jgi:penicillin-binding protein 1C
MKRMMPRLRRRFWVSIAAVAVAAAIWMRLAPLPAGLLDGQRTPSTLVFDRHGVPLYEALGTGGERGVPLSAHELPSALVAATVAAEDHRYWSHFGVDPIAIARAAWRNLRARRVVEGGSTLTQQTAKLLLARQSPHRNRGVAAKIYEAAIALRLEHRLDKREILALYLNLASYGNRIVGAERASQVYFGRSTRALTPAQAAFLAALPQRPSTFNPFKSTDLALRRQRRILRRMETNGFLTPAQAAEAASERLALNRTDESFLVAPHFVEMVLSQFRPARPARIETTLDLELQRDVEGIIRSHRPVLDRHGAGNVAVVVLDNRRGEWLAWEGSGAWLDASRDGAINGAVTPRQPGSTLKPFTYALAFEHGLSPASVLPDIPSHFATAETGVLYAPRNYDGRYRGPLLARRALAGSENVPAVALASELGVPALLRFLTRAGLSTLDKGASYYGLGLTLGNAEVRLDELTAAYAALARGGEWMEPVSVLGVTNRASRRLVSPRTAFWVSDILSDGEAREYIFGRGGSLEFTFPVAVKTGTSQAYHDNWTIGYTREVTVGVWVGNFDRTPLRNSSGITGAAPIFHAVMLAATRRVHAAPGDFIVPPDARLAPREICALSGLSANAWCPTRRTEYLPSEGRPLLPCSWHHQSEDGLDVVWPPQYRQWAQTQRSNDTREGEREKEESVTDRATDKRENALLEIASPPSGATYLIDPTLRREFQTLPLRVRTDRPTDVTWSINGRPLGKSSSESPLSWSLVPGTFEIIARDVRGHSSRAVIVVR